jgi:hypothetical protein
MVGCWLGEQELASAFDPFLPLPLRSREFEADENEARWEEAAEKVAKQKPLNNSG